MFGLFNRGELNQTTEHEFEHFSSRLRQLWLTEHNEDGTHNLNLVASDIPNLDASKITSGTLSDARLSSNVALKDAVNIFTANQLISKTRPEFQFLHSGTAKARTGQDAALHAFLSQNASFDGTNWAKDDYTNNGGLYTIAGQVHSFYGITGASYPPTQNKLFEISNSGQLFERARTVAIGEWTSVAHNAGNFSANGTMTWTVDLADQQTFQYMLVGKTLFVNLYVANATTGGVANTQLWAAIPGGFTSAKAVSFAGWASDNGVGIPTVVSIGVGGTAIVISRADLANWSLSANNNQVRFGIAFEVQ